MDKKDNKIQDKSFTTPKNYFQDFNKDLQIRIIEEKLKERFGNKSHYSVPENYFSNFSAKQDNVKKTTKIITLIKPYLSFAAAIIIIFSLWQIVLVNTNFNENKNGIIVNNNINTQVDESDYILLEDVDVYEISSEDINDNDFEINEDDNELFDYLIEDIDENDFNEIFASL